MKCKSCEGEVPPKFAHAIAMNMCPLCGEEIMDKELQVILVELKNCMTDGVAQYPETIFDWLKSNYHLYTEEELQARIKEAETKTAEAVKASLVATTGNKGFPNKESAKKIELDKDGNQVAGPSLQSQEKTSKFFKNALIDKTVDQQSHFRNIVKQIKKSGSPMLFDEEGTSGVITPDMAEQMGQMDAEEVRALNAAFGNDEEEGGINSGLDSSDMDYEDEIPAIVASNPAFMQQGGGQGQVNMKDVARLQNIHAKQARAKNAMARGGSVGLIRR